MSVEASPNIPYIQARSCADVLKKNRSNFFLSFWFLDKEKRQALNKIYGFARVADDCVDELSDPHEQHQALDFWTAEICKLYRHSEKLHPFMLDLKPVVERFAIPQDYFFGLLEGCRMDVDKKRYASFTELYEYCYRVAGLVGLMCLRIFEYESPTAKEFAINLGLAFQLTNILRDVKDDLKMGRIYFPASEMEKFGYGEKDFLTGVENENFFNFVIFFSGRAEEYYQKACEEFAKDASGKLVAARVMALSYRRILDKIKKQGFPVMHERVSLNPWEKVRVMGRAFCGMR